MSKYLTFIDDEDKEYNTNEMTAKEKAFSFLEDREYGFLRSVKRGLSNLGVKAQKANNSVLVAAGEGSSGKNPTSNVVKTVAKGDFDKKLAKSKRKDYLDSKLVKGKANGTLKSSSEKKDRLARIENIKLRKEHIKKSANKGALKAGGNMAVAGIAGGAVGAGAGLGIGHAIATKNRKKLAAIAAKPTKSEADKAEMAKLKRKISGAKKAGGVIGGVAGAAGGAYLSHKYGKGNISKGRAQGRSKGRNTAYKVGVKTSNDVK